VLDGVPLSDASLVLRTSGSMGKPRLVAFDLGSVVLGARRIAGYLGLSAVDMVALLQPLEHGFGLVGQLFAALAAGARAVWASAPFPDEQAKTLNDAGATVVSAVSYTLTQLLGSGLRPDRVRILGSAGGPMPRPLAERLVETFPGATMWNQYGCTEAGPRLTACPSTSNAFWEGSVGSAIEGVTLAILDDGQVGFRTETAMREYLGDEDATERARAGELWRTGDLGRLDDHGNLFLRGRVDEIVKVRGLKVSLREVAAAFEACGARAAVSFVDEESDPDGEATLSVVYESDAEIPRRALLGHLGLESLPSRTHRIDALPRLVSGKPDRKAIAKRFRKQSS